MTADTQAPAPTGDMVLVPRSVLAPFAQSHHAEPKHELGAFDFDDDDPAVLHSWSDNGQVMETVVEITVGDFRRLREAVTAAPSPSASTMGVDTPAVHLALGHLYGIADAIEAAQPWKAGDIRQHANAITRALACLSSAGGEGTVADRDRIMLRGALWELREYAAMDARDGPAGAVVNLLGQAAYDWLGDRIEAFVADQFASLTPPKAETETLPALPNCGRYLAQDNKGQWHYLNHARSWCGYQGPSTPAETASERERLVEALRVAEERADRAERRADLPIIDGLSLANAMALVELFGGEETDMTVEFIPEGHSGPGFYAWCTEYPEDGSDFLGPASGYSSRAALSTGASR